MRHPLPVFFLTLACAVPSLSAQTAPKPSTSGPKPPASAPAASLPVLRKPGFSTSSSITLLGPRNKLSADEITFVADVTAYLQLDWVFETDETIRRFLLAHPDHLQALLLRAIVLRSRQDPAPAKPLFDAVVRAGKDTVEGQCAALMLDIDSGNHPTTSYLALAALARKNPDYFQLQWLYGIAARLLHRGTDTSQALYPVIVGNSAPLRLLAVYNSVGDDNNVRYLAQNLRERQRAVETAPAGWTYRDLAYTLTRLHREPEAEQAAAKNAELDPQSPLAWITWAEALIRLKRYPDALGKCQKALALDPKSNEAAAIYGFALESSNRAPEAWVQYQKAAGMKPNAGALLAIQPILALPPAPACAEVIKYLAQGKQSDAETIATQLALRFPNNDEVQFLQAVLTRSRFFVAEAAPLFQKAVTLAPDSVHGQCAQLMLSIDTGVNAQQNFDALCDLARHHSDDPLALWTAAIACRTLKCNLEGVEFYGLLCQRFTAAPALLHQTFGNILDELGRHELALAHRKAAVHMEPAFWSVDGMALALAGLQFYEAADAAHAQVCKASPQSRQYLMNWAISLYWWGHYQDAIDKCQKMLALNPKDAGALSEWGRDLEALGRTDEAAQKYREAKEISPASP